MPAPILGPWLWGNGAAAAAVSSFYRQAHHRVARHPVSTAPQPRWIEIVSAYVLWLWSGWR